MIDELPRELADLFAAERAAPTSDLVRQSILRAKLAATVGAAPLGTAAAAGTVGKALATIALVVAAGGSALAVRHATTRHVAPTIAATRIASPVVAAPIARATEPAPVVAPPLPPSPPVIASRAFPRKRIEPPQPTPAPIAMPVPAPAPTEPSQVALLRAAWSSLSAGDALAALDLARRDATLHPDGPLAEERDALAIEALAKLGQRDDARAAATDFLAAHPGSVHRTRIERALEEVR